MPVQPGIIDYKELYSGRLNDSGIQEMVFVETATGFMTYSISGVF